MATYKNIVARDAVAGEDLNRYRVVKANAGGYDKVDESDAGTDWPVGVTPGGSYDQDTTLAAPSGKQVQIYTEGVVLIEAGAAVAIGARVAVDAAGGTVAAAATGDVSLGIALSAAAAAGDLILVQIDRTIAAA